MKTISILVISCLFTLLASAKVITVNNNTNSPGQYSSLQQAIDSASAGDTIYVHGSATSYGNINVKKRLNFFGTGNKPNKTNTLVSEAGNVQLDTLAGISGASGTQIIGFKLNTVIGYGSTGGTRNIVIRRNYFTSNGTKILITGQGWVVENNIVNATASVNVNNHPNTIIRNNIFSDMHISSSNQSTVMISNNVFLGNSAALISVSNALITNNIFSGSTPNGSGVDNNTFSNNLTYQTSSNTIPSGTNTGSGNFVGQNPLFTNAPTNSFNYSYDFTLDSASVGKNAGTDATDIGVFGGVAPFVDMTGTPAIPQIKTLTILNPVISIGDSLQVIIKANKQN